MEINSQSYQSQLSRQYEQMTLLNGQQEEVQRLNENRQIQEVKQKERIGQESQMMEAQEQMKAQANKARLQEGNVGQNIDVYA